MKKILILYTSIGLGHKSIAENIAWHLKHKGHNVELFDALKLQAGMLTKYSEQLYTYLYKQFPGLWRWLYTTSWFISATLPFRTFVARFNSADIRACIERIQPDMIISTQTSASAVVSFLKLKKVFAGLFVIAFSDFHLHRYWLYPNADAYLVNIEEQKQEMMQLGVSAEKIYVCGITLTPRPLIDPVEVRKRLGILPDQKVILVASGSLGVRMPKDLLQQLADIQIDTAKVALIVVCGKNGSLARELKQTLRGAYVFGFYTPMHELYAVADIFITKPGGVSIAEGLQWGVPQVITHWLPGQEELNLEYLTKNNLVLLPAHTKSINQPESTIQLVTQELQKGSAKQALVTNQKTILVTGGNRSGRAIVEAIQNLFHIV